MASGNFAYSDDADAAVLAALRNEGGGQMHPTFHVFHVIHVSVIYYTVSQKKRSHVTSSLVYFKCCVTSSLVI